MAEVLKKFGRYFLLDQIAQGGMAEICRARLAAPDGAGRLIVIKRIQASYGGSNEFLQMFKSEIKTTMGFNHPNIVQLYDFGEEQNQPYIAMELVDGKNLRQFISKCNELKQGFPIPLAVYIAEQVASGLYYAHTYKDKITGEPLNIVHRDVSPQNVLISYEGNVKVIDFGIAKATTNLENTRAGVIKGKPSYLSPEQISGEVLDGRSDLFALGIVLWEMLVGKKLFAGENELAVLKLIEACQTHVKPPSVHNPRVTKELDAIVMKMLSKQADRRYQTADEVQRALHRFLYTFAPDFNPADLAYYAKELFKDQIVEDRKKIQKLNDEVEQLLTVFERRERPQMFTMDGSKSEEKEETTTVVESRLRATGARTFEAEKGNSSLQIEKVGSSATGSRQRGGYVARNSGYNAPAGPQRTQPPTQRAPAKQSGGGGGIGLTFAVVAIAAGFWFRQELFPGASTGPVDPPNPVATKTATPVLPLVDRTPDAIKGPSIVLNFEIKPGAASVELLVNDKPIDTSRERISTVVPLDKPLEIKVTKPGFKPIEKRLILESRTYGRLKEVTEQINLEQFRYGYLTIRTSPPTALASMSINGDPWVRTTPFVDEKLPIGNYTVLLKNEGLGWEKRVDVTIQEGKRVTLDNVRLNPRE
jgi:eukaryotic-like serine/threonine-protein kinase